MTTEQQTETETVPQQAPAPVAEQTPERPEPTPEPVAAEPVAEPAPEPVAEPAPEPFTEPVAALVPVPTAVPTAELVAGPAPKRSRKPILWAVARWTAAVLVCGGVGAGATAGITALERTDVPGLATESDGRWEYPKISLPALPAGVPQPYTPANPGEVHHADLRKLLLPAPAGATVDPKLNGGWVGVAQFASQYRADDRTELTEPLAESALRHIAARGWTMPDGTTTRIHLLRFNSVAFAEAFRDDALKGSAVDGPLLDGVEGVEIDGDLPLEVEVPNTDLYAYVELPQNADQTRWAYIQAGDTLAVITQTRKGEALAVPFQQTVALQNQLLG
ncbi:hypothetical protein ACIPPS_28310 [Streptomyces sp. NPDC090127]|uniref:hypothetical protein n=1 Tax=Streptomyces sp. NPDC090127 TaxID=3365953 RepID=UPI0037FB645B